MESNQKPEVGSALTVAQFDDIFDAFWANLDRPKPGSEDDAKLTLGLVLFNFGDRYSTIRCVEGEWEGVKLDLIKGREHKTLQKVPTCPNGHRLKQDAGLALGWVEDVPEPKVDETANGSTEG